MNKLISLLLCFFLLTLPAIPANEDRSYTAVFSDDSWDEAFFSKISPDFYFEAWDFSFFDYFLNQVKIKAGKRPVTILLAVHGCPSSRIFLMDRNTPKGEEQYVANAGFIINHIERILPGQVDTLYIESCFGGCVLSTSSRYRSNSLAGAGDRIEPWNGLPVPFKIRGIGRVINYPGFAYMQDKYKIGYNVEDLTPYLYKPPVRPNLDKKEAIKVRAVFNLLYVYGMP